MRYFGQFLLLIIFNNFLFSQELSKSSFDLGEISRKNDDVLELNIANYSNEDIFILRIDAPQEADIKIRSKSIPKASATLIRIKLNPKRKGKFKEEVKLYFSSLTEPQTLTISGEVKTIPKNNLQACPSFRSEDMAQKSLAAFQQQRPSPIKKYYVGFGSEEVLDQELANTETSNIVIEEQQQSQKRSEALNTSLSDLRKAQSERQNEEPKGALHNREKKENKQRESPEERRNNPSIIEKLFGDEETESQQPTDPLEEPIEETTTTVDPNLLTDEYKPNNVVFLIDASTSMRKEEKMDLLKQTMIELLTPLRDIDYLSIVTYSGEAEVILPPTSGIEKESIKKSIENIEADGSTQAVKGIKKAIQVGKSNFIKNGNNQIILASDGAFDIGSRNMSLRRKIEKTAKDGLRITVLGIKNDRWTNKSLKEIADLGEGELLHCNKEKDTQKILESVKANSLN